MRTNPVYRFAGRIVAVTATLALSAADSSAQPWIQGANAFGDWDGRRTSLADNGFTLTGSYEGNIAGNVSGGFGRGWGYAENLDLTLNFDLEKMAGWDGATFRIDMVDRNGSSITNDEVGNIFPIQQVFGGNTFLLYGLNLEQMFWDDKASIKVGRFAMNEIFASTPIYWLYMNNGFDGSPKSLFFTGAFTAYPGTEWAARLEVNPSEEWRFLFGVFQVSDRTYDPNEHGVNFDIRGEDGVTFVSQLQWNPEFFKRPVSTSGKETEMRGYPGHYWIGGYVSDWKFDRFDGSGSQRSDYCVYLHGDQQVYQERPGSDEGLTLWAAWVFDPNEEIHLMPYQVSGGVIYKGLVPARPDDHLIFGAIHGWYSDDYARSVRASGAGSPTTESLLELGYRFQLTEFAYAMPEVQYAIRPGGTGEIGNAFIWGLRLGVTF